MTKPPRWRTGDAAAAADVNHRHLTSLIERGIFQLGPDDEDVVDNGQSRLFSRESVFRLATIVRLARAGLHARVAAKIVDGFSASPAAKTHAPFLIADLADGGRLLIDSPANPSINLVCDIAAIVADVELRLRERSPA